MALTLAAVLALFGLGVRLFRRWPGLTDGHGLSGGLRVLGRVALTPKEAICLVRVGTTRGAEVLVVGVSPAGLTLLSRLDGTLVEGSQRPTGGEAAPGGMSGPTSYASRLTHLTTRIREIQAAWGLRNRPARGEP